MLPEPCGCLAVWRGQTGQIHSACCGRRGVAGVVQDPDCSAFAFLQLEERVLDWQSSPASSLNSWFSAAPNWAELVQPALHYLAGESRGKMLFSGGSVFSPDPLCLINSHSELQLYWLNHHGSAQCRPWRPDSVKHSDSGTAIVLSFAF